MTNVRNEHLYVYAAVAGDPGADVLAGIPPLPDGQPPRVIPLDPEISLIVADVPSRIYNEETLAARLSDLDWVAAAGAAHHAVADALAASHVVLPFRLFTVFSSEAKMLATLGRRKARIKEALARVTGREEWVLRIGPPDPARIDSSAAGSIAPAASGTNFLRAKADARRQEAERSARVATAAAEAFETLRPLADDARSRPAEAGNPLLLDAAFLIRSGTIEQFRDALTVAAEGLLRDGCPVSLTGPWPPYSFASLD
jgi:hypothetical protein